MKNKNEGHPLTVLSIFAAGGFIGTKEGEALAARFIDAVDRGEVPSKEDLLAVAKALQPIVTNAHNKEATTTSVMAEVANNMGLTVRQGKELSAIKDQPRLAGSVAVYLNRVEELESQGSKAAKKIALSELCESENIKERAARNRISKHKELAEIMRQEMVLANRIFQKIKEERL